MGGCSDRNELFELLSDRRTIRILSKTGQTPRSVKELSDICDVSGPTLYRHVNTMLEYDLLQEETKIDAQGNHYTVYESNIESATIEITPVTDEVHVDLTYRDSVEQFKHLWEGMKRDS